MNTWLPYQLYVSRLFGRIGPNQRGGAIGFRDQLQDVLPLILTEPRLARAQIVLHAGQQFPEGDVLKWWHRAPGGDATGVAQRTRASDPHLWLPYVLARYVRQTGDASVLDEIAAYLEGPAVPKGQDTALVMPRPSREVGDVYQHARRAIEYTLLRRGENGLPLLGAGDWNDGIDGLGGKGRGASVWMGFFFYNVLDGFIPIARLKGDEAFVETCAAAREDVRVALESAWWGDHYALDFADDGRVVEVANAMTTGWAAYSGALEFQRALIALEGGLSAIERPDRVLLLATPFFEHSQPYPGRIADYPPGVRENGGQYSHGATWIVDGFVKLAEEARDQRRRRRGAQARRARLRDLREDFAAEENRSRSDRGLRADPDPAAGRHLRRLRPRRPRRLVVVHRLGGADDIGRLCAARPLHGRGAGERRRSPVRAEGRAGRRIIARRRTRVEAERGRALRRAPMRLPQTSL